MKKTIDALSKPHATSASVSRMRQKRSGFLRLFLEPCSDADALLAPLRHLDATTADTARERSSATCEDLPASSFAGQHDSFLNLHGREPILNAIRSCWISLFADRAIIYRARNGIDHLAAAMAVVVQVFVPADASGVMFTVEPVDRTRSDRIVIEGCRGTGEAVVSGKASPDRIVLRKADGRIVGGVLPRA